MDEKKKLYETMGELLYVIAMADGNMQEEEQSQIEEILKDHPYGKEIIWSFNYEKDKQPSIENLYQKVINYCHSYGPRREFEEFIISMELIASSSDGIDQDEERIVTAFSADLIERFKKDLEKIKKR